MTRTAASERCGSARNRLSPGPRHEVQFPQARRPPGSQFAAPVWQARRRSDLPIRTGPFQGPSRRRDEGWLPRATGPLRVRVLTGLLRNEPEIDGAPSNGGVRCDPPQGLPRGKPFAVNVAQTVGRDFNSAAGLSAQRNAVHTRALARQVTTRSPHPGLGDDRGHGFLGDRPSRARAHTPNPLSRRGCPPVCVGVPCCHQQREFLAEQKVDGLAVFPPPRPLASP